MSMMKAYIADFRKDYKKKLRWFLVLNVALLFSAAGISLFKTPNHFAIGGINRPIDNQQIPIVNARTEHGIALHP